MGPRKYCGALVLGMLEGQRQRQCVSDTLGHLLQVCLTTAEAVIQRHNAVVSEMALQLRRKSFEVWVERRIITPKGKWRPDLIVKVPCHKSRSGLTK